MERIKGDPMLATGYPENSPTEPCLTTPKVYDGNQRTLRALPQILHQALVSTSSASPSLSAVPGDLHEAM